MNDLNFEQKLSSIYNLIKEYFGETAVVQINVTHKGMEVDLSYKINRIGEIDKKTYSYEATTGDNIVYPPLSRTHEVKGSV